MGQDFQASETHTHITHIQIQMYMYDLLAFGIFERACGFIID